MLTIENFQQVIDAYILEKRSLGFKYKKEVSVLRRVFVLQMQLDQGAPLLSKHTVSTWIEKTP